MGSGIDADDTDLQARIAAFQQGLREAGWSKGGNLQIDIRFGSGNADRIRQYATELVALAPDVIMSGGAATLGPVQQATHTIPIVFTAVTDPVGAGFRREPGAAGRQHHRLCHVRSLVDAKWLELLKQIAPDVTRVAVFRDAALAAGHGQFGAIQTAAPSLGVELSPVDVRDTAGIERALAAFARAPRGGIIATASALMLVHRDLIIRLAAQYKLPAVYHRRAFVEAGGLVSYGPDIFDQHRRAAGYVDRILKGEKPADLPVQAPTKYELVINLKTAKALGLDVPPLLLARADEVIE